MLSRNGFRGFGVNRKEEVEKLMKKEHLTFEDVMDHDSVIHEFKQGNEQL